MNSKRFFAVALSVLLLFCLAACSSSESGGDSQNSETGSAEPGSVDITKEPDPDDATEVGPHIRIFASESAIYFLSMASDAYAGFRPAMTTAILLDQNDVLTEKILSDYDCDIFITDNPYYLNYIDKDGGEDNPYGLDLLVEGSRTELFKYVDEENDQEIVWEAAILKRSAVSADCQQFIDWMKDEMDESIYTQCGVVKP